MHGMASCRANGKGGSLMRTPLLLVLLFALSSCNEDEPASQSKKSADAARIEKEVTRRVEAAKLESTLRTNRLQTIRMIGLLALAGGAVGGLVWLRQSRVPAQASGSAIQQSQPPLWQDHYPTYPGRVIDFPTSPANHRQRHPPNRRSQPK